MWQSCIWSWVSGMTHLQLVQTQPQVFTAKCSEAKSKAVMPGFTGFTVLESGFLCVDADLLRLSGIYTAGLFFMNK